MKLFDGIRVLDLSRMLAGPYGPLLLADMGADVIKSEGPAGGDAMREMGPPFLAGGESAYFLAINRNKKSVALDLTKPEGRQVFVDLVAHADVVWENFRPGVMERLRCDYATLAGVNPRLVMCSISAYGQDGPYRDWPAFDLALQAMGGAMSLTGEEGRPPVRMGLPMGDLAGGMFAAFAVAGALLRRSRTGQGQHIDLALLDVQASLLTYLAQYHWADGRIPGPSGTGHQTVVPYDSFECSDGINIVVAVFTERFWKPFCEVIGMPELIEQYPTNNERLAGREELLAVLRHRF